MAEYPKINEYNDKSPSAYRENILEIVRAWNTGILGGSYPIRGENEIWPAYNAGVVQLKCFINNTCPFLKSPLKINSLVFSKRTWDRIKENLPKGLEREALTAVEGLDGLFFTPKTVHRHTYMFERKRGSTDNIAKYMSSSGVVASSWYTNWYDNFEEIQSYSQKPLGVDQTRYKDEQSWVVERSVFDRDIKTEDEEGNPITECYQAKWRYYKMGVPDSGGAGELQYDYRTAIYDEYEVYKKAEEAILKQKDFNVANNVANAEEIYRTAMKGLGVCPIERNVAQIPIQTRIYSVGNANEPVHWRVSKKTPLFKGEDFFITFYREAESPSINRTSQEKKSFVTDNSAYMTLDINNTGKTAYVVSGKNKSEQRINSGVVFNTAAEGSNEKENPEYDFSSFNFYRKAYYIIELGYMTFDTNYFIILCQGAAPILVKAERKFIAPLSEGGPSAISRVISICPFIDDCSTLISAKNFTISVRNHLGKLAITFSGGGAPNQVWLVSYSDLEPKWDNNAGEVKFVSKSSIISVPRGLMTIWGGNLKAGFTFGILQSKVTSVDFLYPPATLRPLRGGDFQSAFDNVSPIPVGTCEESSEGEKGCNRGEFENISFFLPLDGRHHIFLSSSNVYLDELYNDFTQPSGSKVTTNQLFTQGAEYYRDYNHSSNGDWMYGGFMYGPSLREASDILNSWCRRSVMTIRKYRYSNNSKTRQQEFDVLIGMISGDHAFTSSSWTKLTNWDNKPTSPPISNPLVSPVSYKDILDNIWFVRGCKSPILTHLTLASEESSFPRWSDGTSVAHGINRTPYEGGSVSPYFIDASDHVLSYSDSWSANEFYSVDHSGSISFYLNESADLNPNVTNYLESLMNKNFYIEIWAGYRGCNTCGTYGLFKLFTGICQGGELSYEYNKRIMNCKIVDYSTVLKAVKFFNSPWYDGLKDINAIFDIMSFAGFRYLNKYDPGKIIFELTKSAISGNSNTFFHHFDGRPFTFQVYALPSGYSRLEQPAFKFNDGDNLYDAIMNITRRAAKCFFFDQFGIAHFENLQDVIEQDYLGKTYLNPLFQFTTNPYVYGGQLVHNKVDLSFGVDLVTNHIKIMSTTPDMHLIIHDRLNYASLEDPTVNGFLGYMKTLYQQQGIFGSAEAVSSAATKYTVTWKPKIHMKFETYGMPLRANDIVSLDGEILRVMNVNHRLSGQENIWWMEVECERYQIIN